MKPWHQPNYDASIHYDLLLNGRHCWACHASSKPAWYLGPWWCERAHIVNKPRREDRRCVVILCSVCHKISHGERFSGVERPRLLVEHLLWLKLERDEDWWDLDYLQRCSVRILPNPMLLPSEYFSLRGGGMNGSGLYKS